MKQLPAIWATLLVVSSVALAFLSFCTLDDVVEGVLFYIAQSLLFAASVAGVPLIIDLNKIKHNDKDSKNNPKSD